MQIRNKLKELKLSNKAVWDREHAREAAGGGVETPWYVRAVYYSLCLFLDVAYDNRWGRRLGWHHDRAEVVSRAGIAANRAGIVANLNRAANVACSNASYCHQQLCSRRSSMLWCCHVCCRPIQRFWFLETVARMPYFSYITMLHLYESFGWWRAGEQHKRLQHSWCLHSNDGTAGCVAEHGVSPAICVWDRLPCMGLSCELTSAYGRAVSCRC